MARFAQKVEKRTRAGGAGIEGGSIRRHFGFRVLLDLDIRSGVERD